MSERVKHETGGLVGLLFQHNVTELVFKPLRDALCVLCLFAVLDFFLGRVLGDGLAALMIFELLIAAFAGSLITSRHGGRNRLRRSILATTVLLILFLGWGLWAGLALWPLALIGFDIFLCMYLGYAVSFEI